MPIKVAAVGSREYCSIQEVDSILGQAKILAANSGETLEVVTAQAEGVNARVMEWCNNNSVPCTMVPVDWSIGDDAGCKVNSKILEGISILIAFWDGRSENTLDIIVRAKKNKGIKVLVNVR